MSNSKIIVALDYPEAKSAMHFVDAIDPMSCKLKVGKELFTREGPQFVSRIINSGFDVFLDLKFHDIPNTVMRACQAAADLGVWMLNVHAMGGRAMMEAALEGLNKSGHHPYLIAVTVLTSMDDRGLAEIGISNSAEKQVSLLAGLVRASGLNGVVCSAHEATKLREESDNSFLLVTPGIRPDSADAGDQKRVMTPLKAVEAGANYLVIGRPITQAAEPVNVLEEINQQLG
ncbi:MAG: orotidine-5'-phosphate decarboxylase [Thioalkalispiraceae bacterium]|jgi:orotidine-5'-phosphate decarboxylase